MEFIKVKNGYLIKNSNGRIVSEKEKLELENKELILKDIKSNECQGKTTQKLTKNKKKIKDIEEKVVNIEELETAPIMEEDGADDIIEETDNII